MAIDLEAIKNKLNKLQTTTTRQNNLWKPEPGKQQIRIVPYQYDRNNPFQELYFHYDIGKKNFLSPITNGNPDPVQEFAEKLKSTGNSDEWKLGKKLEPKLRTYVPIIVRGKESEGVKFWGFGKTVYTELLGFMADPDYGDISDPMNGRDIVVEFMPAEGNSYAKTTIRIKPNTSPVTDNKDIAKKITSQQQNLSEIFKEPTYDELKSALEEWLNPSEDSSATTQTSESSVNSTPAPTNSIDDVSAAFDSLFNED
jgi:hypothetical protein